MGYCVSKSGQGWRVVFEQWMDGVKSRRHVKRPEYANLGLAGCTSIEEAREAVKHLNAQTRLLQLERRRNKLAARRDHENLIECAHLPADYVAKFQAQIVKAKGLREPHWEEAKRAIRVVSQPPSDWYSEPHHFYNYFESRGHSPDYANRIIRMLNEWGRFYCRKTNSFWQDVPKPRGSFLNRIRRAYEKKTDGGRYRARLSLAALEERKRELAVPEYNWLLISVAFGLRPEEINQSLRTAGRWGYRDGTLYVYQPKLERVESNAKKRWKRIELKMPHQRRAIQLILSGDFKAPTRKKLKSLFGPKMTHYGGRKEFFPFMRKSFDAYTVSKWMGHATLETAMRHYDDPEDDFPEFTTESVSAKRGR